MITIDALFSPAVIMDAREPSAGMTGEWRFCGIWHESERRIDG
jgi:hypothetical protein